MVVVRSSRRPIKSKAKERPFDDIISDLGEKTKPSKPRYVPSIKLGNAVVWQKCTEFCHKIYDKSEHISSPDPVMVYNNYLSYTLVRAFLYWSCQESKFTKSSSLFTHISRLVLSPGTESYLFDHLETIRSLLSKSRRLSKNIPFSIKRKTSAANSRQIRTGSIFRQKFDFDVPKKLFETFKTNLINFWHVEEEKWLAANDRQTELLQDVVYSTLNLYLRRDQAEAHQALVRRLNSVALYLLFKALPVRYDPRLIADSFHGVSLFTDLSQEELQKRISQFCDAGIRYLNLASHLGGIGAIWCLPLEVARTAWERYLPKAGEDFQTAINHLKLLGLAKESRKYNKFVKELLRVPIQPLSRDVQTMEMCLGLLEECDDPVSIHPVPATTFSVVPSVSFLSPPLVPTPAFAHESPDESSQLLVPPNSDFYQSAWLNENRGLTNIETCHDFHYRSQQVFIRVPMMIPYDSDIFIHVQNGHVDEMTKLLISGSASIDTVDPYGLGLLYYAVYYCWRSLGAAAAFATCKALLDLGANPTWCDEIGNTPVETIIDEMLISQRMQSGKNFDPSSLAEVGLLFGKTSCDLWTEYKESRHFTILHHALLGVSDCIIELDTCLQSLKDDGLLESIIDANDSRGRSALAWAVEHGWANAADTLLKFGANVHQQRLSMRGQSPLLYLAIAGPAQRLETGRLDVFRMLICGGTDINATDHELWTSLHIAASWNLYDVLLELAYCGNNELNWQASTENGGSALDLAMYGGSDPRVIKLLSSPADNWRVFGIETY